MKSAVKLNNSIAVPVLDKTNHCYNLVYKTCLKNRGNIVTFIVLKRNLRTKIIVMLFTFGRPIGKSLN